MSRMSAVENHGNPDDVQELLKIPCRMNKRVKKKDTHLSSTL